MQEFAFDTICMCTCGMHVADMHDVHGVVWSFQHLHVIRNTQSAHIWIWNRIWTDPWSDPEIMESARISTFEQSWRFWPDPGFLVRPWIRARILVRGRIWPEPSFWPDPGSDQDSGCPTRFQVRARMWPEPTFWPDPGSDLESGSDLAKVPIQALYIDHFQLPPRWKMTGEDGDPFGKSDWHWPSKRRDFEKNLLITKSLIIAEKGTFFSFTPKKSQKLTIFLAPPIEICRHLRRVVPTAYRPIFRFFWGSKNRKKIDFFWYFFGTSGEHFFWSPDGILPDPGSGQNHGSGQICGFWQVLYGPSQSGQKVDFLHFSYFFEILLFFVIFADFRDFWTFATFLDFRDFSGNLYKSTILQIRRSEHRRFCCC